MSEQGAEIIKMLMELDIEAPAGALIEEFIDDDEVTPDLAHVFERFLLSNDLNNRSVALLALVEAGKMYNYASDALLLHFQSREVVGAMPEQMVSLSYIYSMANGGSREAKRVADILASDPFVKRLQRN